MVELMCLIMVVFGVLQIILFFKVWGMTNNIKNIKEEYHHNIENYNYYIKSINEYLRVISESLKNKNNQ